ncbi:hypothetical protein ACJX0J_029966, partial [Zea mays]
VCGCTKFREVTKIKQLLHLEISKFGGTNWSNLQKATIVCQICATIIYLIKLCLKCYIILKIHVLRFFKMPGKFDDLKAGVLGPETRHPSLNILILLILWLYLAFGVEIKMAFMKMISLLPLPSIHVAY